MVSSPILMNSKLISIGRPLTPIAQDDSWANHPQDSPREEESPSTPPTQVTTPVLDDDDFEAQPTPSPQASPVFHRLRKGPRPQVTLSSVLEGEEHHHSVSRQVFPEATPTVNISESEAKAAEDIQAASADEQEEPPSRRRTCCYTPRRTKKLFSRRTCPTLQLLKWRLITLRRPPTPILKPMMLSWLKQMWHLKSMWRLKLMSLKLLMHLKSILHLKSLYHLQLTSMPMLLYRLQGHTLSSWHLIAANLSWFADPFWFLLLLPDLNLTIMWSTGLRSRSQNRGCQGFQVLQLHQDLSM